MGRAAAILVSLLLLAYPAAAQDSFTPYDPIHDAVDTSADEECLTRETGTSGKYFEWQACGGAGGAPTDADYLVGTANGSLSAEIAVGTSPGGELGGTWASPTVDATHSGSAHHSAVTLAADADVLLGLSTQELNFDTQTANTIFAGPTTGAAADPTFRALVDDDIPNDITITETDPNALLTAGTDNVKDTHIDWGTGAGQVNPADFADQDIGDITITTGAWAVEDDSHAHTTTTLSGIVDADMGNDALDPDKLVGDATDDDKVDSSIVEQNAGTDISADLEEEAHASEHAVGGADGVFAADPNVNAAWVWDDTAGAGEWGALGDLTYSGTAFAVTDDSHAHATTTLSGIDIGDDTNLAAGRSLTLSGDSVEADAETYDWKCEFSIESPADADDLLLCRAHRALTVTDIDCIVESATSAVVVFIECDADGDNCGSANSRLEESITCAVTNTADDGTIGNAAIAAGARFRAQVGTVTGTVGHVTLNAVGTFDD